MLLHCTARGVEWSGHEDANVVVAVTAGLVSHSDLQSGDEVEEMALGGHGGGGGACVLVGHGRFAGDELVRCEVFHHLPGKQPPSIVFVALRSVLVRDGLEQFRGPVRMGQAHREVLHAPQVDVRGEQRAEMADESVLLVARLGTVREEPLGLAAEGHHEGDPGHAGAEQLLLVVVQERARVLAGLLVVVDARLENEVQGARLVRAHRSRGGGLLEVVLEEQLEGALELFRIGEEPNRSGHVERGLDLSRRAADDVLVQPPRHGGLVVEALGHELGEQEAVLDARLDAVEVVAGVVAEDVALERHPADIRVAVRHEVHQQQVLDVARPGHRPLQDVLAVRGLLGVRGRLQHRLHLEPSLLEGGLAHRHDHASRLVGHLREVRAVERGELAQDGVELLQQGPEGIAHDGEEHEHQLVALVDLMVSARDVADLVRVIAQLAPEGLDDHLRGALEVAFDVVVLLEEAGDDVDGVGMVAVDVEVEEGREGLQDIGQGACLVVVDEDQVRLDGLEHLGGREARGLLPVEPVVEQGLGVARVDGGECRGELRGELRSDGGEDGAELVGREERVSERVHEARHGGLQAPGPQLVSVEKSLELRHGVLQHRGRLVAQGLGRAHLREGAHEGLGGLDGGGVVEFEPCDQVATLQHGALRLAVHELAILWGDQGDVHLHHLHLSVGFALANVAPILDGVANELSLHFGDESRGVVLAREHVSLRVHGQPQSVGLLSPVHDVALAVEHSQKPLVREFVDFDASVPVGVSQLDVVVARAGASDHREVLGQVVNQRVLRFYNLLHR
mmetsp:Transcript_19676/g.39870  ORF Transcript_19676/g.39870 Transcript_19676/m.39870 type:complete len:793 (+) Transcript_19676:2860-5238(+)